VAENQGKDRSLAELSAALGQSVSFDKSDQSVLLFDGDVEVVLTDAADLVSVRSVLLPPTPQRTAMSLALNYGQLPPGVAVALDQESGLLVLFGYAETANPSPDALVSLVARVVDLVPEVRTKLAAADTPSGAPDSLPTGAIRA
jgi:hypothetical protein